VGFAGIALCNVGANVSLPSKIIGYSGGNLQEISPVPFVYSICIAILAVSGSLEITHSVTSALR
jgi:hypothetical protein